MAAALFTAVDIDQELALTADYDVANDLAKARRRIVALRRKLDLPQSAGHDQENVTLAMDTIEKQLYQALVWLAANDTQTDAQREQNPDVTHADFSTFRGYS